MYREIHENARMTDVEASSRYPDCYIIIRMDSMDSDMGNVLYVGDNRSELSSLLSRLENPAFCGILEGTNHRRSLGGVLIGA